MATGSGSCRRKRRELVSDELERWPFRNPTYHTHQKCFHLKCVVYECGKFRKRMIFSTRHGKCFRNSNIDLTKSSGLKKLTESHSENEIEKESPVREAKMLLYWVTTTTIFVLYYKYFSYPICIQEISNIIIFLNFLYIF